MQRISVVGNSGAGKTTLASALARALQAPLLELDSIYHQRDWTPLPLPEFRSQVAEFVAGDAWVVDGNYGGVQDLVWASADTVVWVDPPRWQTVVRLTRRTLGRAITRRELWNGNRERLADILSQDPDRSVLRWSWRRHPVIRERYAAAMASPENTRLRFERIRTRHERARLLDATVTHGHCNP